MMKHILIPLDGSDFAAQAIPVAMDIAKRAGPKAVVELVTVFEPLPDAQGTPVLDPRYDESVQAGLKDQLEDQATELRKQTKAAITTTVLVGPVTTRIAEHAARQGAELVVMTTHGRGGLSRLWLGSTAEGLVRRIALPVLLLRPSEERVTTTIPFRRVLIPLDGSGFGEEAIPLAMRLAGKQDVEYVLSQVIQAVPVVLSAASPAHDQKLFEARETVASDYLDQQVTAARGRGAEARGEVLSHEHVARAINEFVEAEDVDLIAMVTHGRGEMSRMLFGSVADKLIRSSKVPILLSRPTGG